MDSRTRTQQISSTFVLVLAFCFTVIALGILAHLIWAAMSPENKQALDCSSYLILGSISAAIASSLLVRIAHGKFHDSATNKELDNDSEDPSSPSRLDPKRLELSLRPDSPFLDGKWMTVCMACYLAPLLVISIWHFSSPMTNRWVVGALIGFYSWALFTWYRAYRYRNAVGRLLLEVAPCWKSNLLRGHLRWTQSTSHLSSPLQIQMVCYETRDWMGNNDDPHENRCQLWQSKVPCDSQPEISPFSGESSLAVSVPFPSWLPAPCRMTHNRAAKTKVARDLGITWELHISGRINGLKVSHLFSITDNSLELHEDNESVSRDMIRIAPKELEAELAKTGFLASLSDPSNWNIQYQRPAPAVSKIVCLVGAVLLVAGVCSVAMGIAKIGLFYLVEFGDSYWDHLVWLGGAIVAYAIYLGYQSYLGGNGTRLTVHRSLFGLGSKSEWPYTSVERMRMWAKHPQSSEDVMEFQLDLCVGVNVYRVLRARNRIHVQALGNILAQRLDVPLVIDGYIEHQKIRYTPSP